MLLQRNRIYSLIVGNADEGWEITDLHITFDVIKTSSNKDKSNSARIEIYNLSREKQVALEEPYVGVVLSVGYLDGGLRRLFAGRALEVTTRKAGTDVVTVIQMGNDSFVELNHQTLRSVVPEGRLVEDAIQEILKSVPGVSRNVITGINCKNPLIDGYPLSSTPKQALDELCKAYELEYQVDDGVIYISDAGDTHTSDLNSVVVIGQDSGLIERPFVVYSDVKKTSGESATDSSTTKKTKKKKVKGIQFKCLINPELVCGSLIKLEYENLTGYYKIDSIRTYGGFRTPDWYMDIKLTERVG